MLDRSLVRVQSLPASLAMVAGLVLTLAGPAHTAVYDTIALSHTDGALGPGLGGGEQFFSFSEPTINAEGQICFRGSLRTGVGGVSTSDDRGLWLAEAGGSLTQIARKGMQATGTASGSHFAGFQTLVLNDQGQLAFTGFLSTGTGDVTSDSDGGLWWHNGSALELVAREGSQAAGLTAGASYGSFGASTATEPLLSSPGKIAFFNQLQTGSGGVDTSNHMGIWSGQPGSLALAARRGDAVPGVAGKTFFSLSDPVLNDSGDVAFTGTFLGGAGLFSNRSGPFEPVITSDDVPPGTPPGAEFNDFMNLTINDSKHVAFRAALLPGVGGATTENNVGIWSDATGSLALVTREGDQAPGTPAGANFRDIGAPLMDAAGRVAFLSNLQTGVGGVTSDTSSGIWSQASGTLELVAREGEVAHGTVAAVFDELTIFSGVDLLINGAGQVAFAANLRVGVDGVTIGSDRGIWAQNGEGDLVLVVREGDLFDVDPSDLGVDNRTIKQIGFGTHPEPGVEDGRPRAWNDQGMLGFTLVFTDSTRGVFTADLNVIPEPATGVLVVALFAGLTMRRRGPVGVERAGGRERGAAAHDAALSERGLHSHRTRELIVRLLTGGGCRSRLPTALRWCDSRHLSS